MARFQFICVVSVGLGTSLTAFPAAITFLKNRLPPCGVVAGHQHGSVHSFSYVCPVCPDRSTVQLEGPFRILAAMADASATPDPGNMSVTVQRVLVAAAALVMPVLWGLAVHAVFNWMARRRGGPPPQDPVFPDYQI